MPDRPPTFAATAVPPGTGSPWQPVGGAFAASFVLHALALASLAALFVHPSGIAGGTAPTTPLYAVLTAAPREEAPPPVQPPTMRPSERTARRDVPVLAVPAPAPTASVAPWSSLPTYVELPPGMFGTPMVSEGVEYLETRSIVQLGVDIERRVFAEFPDEPEYPVVLHPAGTLGYPLDALAAGIEGRVMVWFIVDEEGKVEAREALDGPFELTEWTLSRLDRLVAGPARDKDRPRRAWIALEIVFTRDTAEAARASRDGPASATTPSAASR